MEFTGRFRHTATTVFNIMDTSGSSRIDAVSLDENNVYSKGIIIDITKDIVEIPVIARSHCENIIQLKLNYPDVTPTEKIILPLYTNSYPQNKRTFDSIYSHMTCLPYANRLQKYITNKEDVYYGARGLLLDSNMEPLFLCTLASKFKKEIMPDNSEKLFFEYIRPVFHVSPKVFGDDSTKMMEKSIIKKLIPFYSNMTVFTPGDNRNIIDNVENNICKVVIDNFNEFFIEPVKPTPNTCSDKILNQCLVDNIEDVITHLTL